MNRALMNVIAWVTARHIAHFEANKGLVAVIGAKLMRLSNREEFDVIQASLEQREALTEIKALSAAIEIKKMAGQMNGWEDHHGIGLEMVSGVLMDQCDWEPEDVNDFVDRLTEGFFNFRAADGDDFDPDLFL